MFENAYKCIGEFNGTWKRPLAKLDNETQTYIMFEKKTKNECSIAFMISTRIVMFYNSIILSYPACILLYRAFNMNYHVIILLGLSFKLTVCFLLT